MYKCKYHDHDRLGGHPTTDEIVTKLIDLFAEEWSEHLSGHKSELGRILVQLDFRICDGKNKRQTLRDFECDSLDMKKAAWIAYTNR